MLKNKLITSVLSGIVSLSLITSSVFAAGPGCVPLDPNHPTTIQEVYPHQWTSCKIVADLLTNIYSTDYYMNQQQNYLSQVKQNLQNLNATQHDNSISTVCDLTGAVISGVSMVATGMSGGILAAATATNVYNLIDNCRSLINDINSISTTNSSINNCLALAKADAQAISDYANSAANYRQQLINHNNVNHCFTVGGF